MLSPWYNFLSWFFFFYHVIRQVLSVTVKEENIKFYLPEKKTTQHNQDRLGVSPPKVSYINYTTHKKFDGGILVSECRLFSVDTVLSGAELFFGLIPHPPYLVFVCIRTWRSVTYKNEVTVTLIFIIKVKYVILSCPMQNFFFYLKACALHTLRSLWPSPKMSIPKFMSDLEIPLDHIPLGVPSIVTEDFNIWLFKENLSIKTTLRSNEVLWFSSVYMSSNT